MKRIKIDKYLKQRKIMLCIISIVMIFVTNCQMPASAENSEQKVIRVGYVNAANYEEGGEGEYKTGSGYEYLQKISYLTGWKYEYVYGTFKDCYQMLIDGKIDLFGNVSYTPERAELFDFSSYPQGKDTYLMYTTKDRTDLIGGDLSQLNGCKIGATEGSYQTQLLKSWLENNHIQAEVLTYSGYEALMKALDYGHLDAIVTPDLAVSYDYPSIISIGFSEYYFAVSKSRPDVLEELNEALYELQNTEEDFNNLLASKYNTNTTRNLMLNEKERAWLKEHDNTIRLGYISDDLPYCGEEDGAFIGVMKTVTDTVEEKFHITVKKTAYKNQEEIRQAIQRQEIDIAGPVLSDFYLAEQENCVLTNTIMDTTPVVIYKGEDVEGKMDVIAATGENVFESKVIQVLFPDAQIYPCDTQKECLEAVASGKAGSTLVLSARLNILSSDPIMKKLSFAEMAKKAQICLVAPKDNRRAASIVNKGISMSSDVLNGVVLTQHSVVNEKISVIEFITEHAWFFIIFACIIILMLGALIYRLYVSRRKMENALTEAQSANIAKTTFLNNMSHDIRTPMNAIIGFANIAMKHDPPLDIKNCLEKIEESSEHLLTLINDVLDISRIESGKIKYAPIPVDITTVTDTVLDITNGFLVNRDLQLHVNRQLPQHPYVLADVVRIREILVNILGNAVKFTDDGGSITFETEYHAGEDEQHIVVCYRISDTGIGMSEEFRKKLFDEFAQEDSGARTQYKGTGLGMTITKRYVELMNGTIFVKSEKGVGSTFVVYIPLELTEQENVQKETWMNGQANLTGIRVLLAEDNDLNAEIAVTQLESYGMKVTRASDGKEAVRLFAENPVHTFDLILMDIMMPQMNGYEASKTIRTMFNRPDAMEIPIIAMTANAFSEDIQASLDAGMNAHLAKPVRVEELIDAICRFCRMS